MLSEIYRLLRSYYWDRYS